MSVILLDCGIEVLVFAVVKGPPLRLCFGESKTRELRSGS